MLPLDRRPLPRVRLDHAEEPPSPLGLVGQRLGEGLVGDGRDIGLPQAIEVRRRGTDGAGSMNESSNVSR